MIDPIIEIVVKNKKDHKTGIDRISRIFILLILFIPVFFNFRLPG
jgi:hypothetical protein